MIFAGTNGFVDDLTVEEIRSFEKGLYEYADTMGAALLDEIMKKKILDDQLKAGMKKLIVEFKERFAAEKQQPAAASR